MPRACKQPLIEVGKRKQSPQKESAHKLKRSDSLDYEEMDDYEEENGEQLQAPVFKLGEGSGAEVSEPSTYREAAAGPINEVRGQRTDKKRYMGDS